MKKFLSVIPLQPSGSLRPYQYRATGNEKLQMEGTTCFPICTVLNGYAKAGEEIRVIAVAQEGEFVQGNLEILRREVVDICQKKELRCSEIETIPVSGDQRVSNYTAIFQALIDRLDDDDELFACMTYGTKPMSMALTMAIQYAYRIKRNVSISCLVYGMIQRPEKDPRTWYGEVYDMTALVQLDELVHLLAERKVANPKAAIDAILSL